MTPDGVASWMTEGVHPEGYDKIATDYLTNHAKNDFIQRVTARPTRSSSRRSIRCGLETRLPSRRW